MAKYHVHCYAIVRVRVANVEAETPQQAIEQAVEAIDWHRTFPERNYPDSDSKPLCITDMSFAEGFDGYLVDVDGDKDCEQSKYYADDPRVVDNKHTFQA